MAETESTAPVPPALPLAPIERVNDFPDKLSPMLVKELRQGLRTQTFVILFLVLQGLLALVLLTAGPIAASDDSSSGAAGGVVSQIVFCIYALGVLLVQPLRGISAVATEIKQNTIDLMVLTRLSSWRIVWGKWCSIVSQSSLILLAILPYLILRYFFGGMQLFAEIGLMLYIFILSGALTAFTVGLSAVGSPLIRGLVVVAGSALLVVFIPFFFTPDLQDYINALSFTNRDESLAALGILAMAFYAGYFFLELGATAIAPAAENRATRKRVIGLVVILVAYFLLQFVSPLLALFSALAIAGLISLDLFTERAEFPSVVCRPFLRFGMFGRLAGRLLYPGWASGTMFFVLMLLIIMGMVALNLPTGPHGSRHLIFAGAGFGAMLFPAALMQMFSRNTDKRFTIYVSLTIMSFLLVLILNMLFEGSGDKLLLWIFTPVPMVFFPIADETAFRSDLSTVLFAVWGITGAYLLIVLAGAFPKLGQIGKLEEAAEEELAEMDQ